MHCLCPPVSSGKLSCVSVMLPGVVLRIYILFLRSDPKAKSRLEKAGEIIDTALDNISETRVPVGWQDLLLPENSEILAHTLQQLQARLRALLVDDPVAILSFSLCLPSPKCSAETVCLQRKFAAKAKRSGHMQLRKRCEPW